MPAYPMELRERVLADCDRGMSTKEVASKYQVSRSWVDRLKQRRRETGEIGPRPPRRFKPQVIAPHMGRLRELVVQFPNVTLSQLREKLEISASLMSIWRAVQKVRQGEDSTNLSPSQDKNK